MGRETFVSGELLVTSAELGRYGAPEPGRIALDRPTEMAIHCNHKVMKLRFSETDMILDKALTVLDKTPKALDKALKVFGKALTVFVNNS